MQKNEYALQGLISLRDHKTHMSSLMLLHIVNHIEVAGKGAVSIDEVDAYYHARRVASPGIIDYSRGGIASMLHVMEKRNMLLGSRDGRYKMYSVSPLGNHLLDSIYS